MIKYFDYIQNFYKYTVHFDYNQNYFISMISFEYNAIVFFYDWNAGFYIGASQILLMFTNFLSLRI